MSSNVMTCWALVLLPQASVTVHVRVMMLPEMQLEAPWAVMEAVPPLVMDIMLPATSVQLRTISSLETDWLYSAVDASTKRLLAPSWAPKSPAPLMLLMRTSM